MGTAAISILILLGGALLVLVWAIALYNGLVKKRVNTDNAWAQIDVQLKRRYDLIPNLIEVVKGYAGHEKETLESVINARNLAMGSVGKGEAERGQAENMLSGTLKSLFALQEAYPDLKANENFLNLQEELTSTENKISFARQHYNDTVGTYLTAMQVFPANIISGMFNFEKREFFEMNEADAEAAQTPPKVEF